MDWSIVQQYLPFYQKAFFLTLHIAVLGIFGSFLLGLVVSVIRHYRVPILSQLSTAYIRAPTTVVIGARNWTHMLKIGENGQMPHS